MKKRRIIMTTQICLILLVLGIGSKCTTVQGEPLDKQVAIPLPVQAHHSSQSLPEKSPQITLTAESARLENSFFQVDLTLDKGLLITGIINKFVNQNILNSPSRLFLVQYGQNVIGNDKYRLKDSSVQESGAERVLHTTWQCTEASLELNLDIKIGGFAELTCEVSIRNTDPNEKIFAVTCPFLEHIQIGSQVSDDSLFFPSETGICGSVDYDLREIYGYSSVMQVMNVFDPVVGGGIYTYAKDKTGTPKIVIIRRQSLENTEPPKHNHIWYQNQDIGDVFDNKPSSAMAFRHLEYQLKSGESAQLTEMVIGIHQGDWHESLRQYSQWAHTWYRKEFPTPKWYMDTYSYLSGHPFAGLHLLSGKPADPAGAQGGFWDPVKKEYTYSRQMGRGEENCLMEFAMWDNYKTNPPNLSLEEVNKFYSGDVIAAFQFGDYDYSVERGGLEQFRNEIGRIHDKKGRFLLYSYPEACWQGCRIGKLHGKEWACMSAPGKYSTRFTTAETGWNLCIYHPDFRKWFSEMIAVKVKELGTDGFRQDVLSYMFPCFNSEHPHYNGSVRSALPAYELGRLQDSTQRAVRAISPEKVVTTEHAGSDYLTQFSDGFLTQNIAMFAHEALAPFRGFNQYKLCFMRFYFPEIKTFLQGISPSEEAVKIGLFNAVGLAIMPPEGVLVFDSIRENGDAVNSLMPPEPMIDTLVENVYANYFPGPNKKVWTVYNRSGKKVDQPLISVLFKEGVHYIEVLKDISVTTQRDGNSVKLSVPVENEEVICIAELPNVAVAEISDGCIEVTIDSKYTKKTVARETANDIFNITEKADESNKDISLQVVYGQDLPGQRQILTIDKGKDKVKTPKIPSGTQKTIIKVMNGYYLLDEIIVLPEKEK
ncbi:MAG: hypothetical protein ACYC54_10790 [Sedimentisphaerales bacterium]